MVPHSIKCLDINAKEMNNNKMFVSGIPLQMLRNPLQERLSVCTCQPRGSGSEPLCLGVDFSSVDSPFSIRQQKGSQFQVPVIIHLLVCRMDNLSLWGKVNTTVMILQHVHGPTKQGMTKIYMLTTSHIQAGNLNTLKQLLSNTRACAGGGRWTIIQRYLVPVV